MRWSSNTLRNATKATTTFYVGTARLPGRGQFGEALVVELEVEPGSKTIVAVDVSLGLAGMRRIVTRELVGRRLDDVEGAIRHIRAHYHSPMQDALCAAILRAAKAETARASP